MAPKRKPMTFLDRAALLSLLAYRPGHEEEFISMAAALMLDITKAAAMVQHMTNAQADWMEKRKAAARARMN